MSRLEELLKNTLTTFSQYFYHDFGIAVALLLLTQWIPSVKFLFLTEIFLNYNSIKARLIKDRREDFF